MKISFAIASLTAKKGGTETATFELNDINYTIECDASEVVATYSAIAPILAELLSPKQ